MNLFLKFYYIISFCTLLAFIFCLLDIKKELKIYFKNNVYPKEIMVKLKYFKTNKIKVFIQMIFICFCPLINLFSFYLFTCYKENFVKEVIDAVLNKIKEIKDEFENNIE